MSWLRSRLAAPSPSMVVAVVAVVIAAGGVTYAAIPDSGTSVYHACMLKNVGTIRIIDPSLPSSNATSHCSSFETAITWNQQGPKGEPGIQGLKGERGIQGVKGDQGIQGVKGETGATGLKGDNGAPGTNGHDGQPGADGHDGTPGQDGQSFSWRGNWNTLAVYLPRDVISYLGSSYIAVNVNAGDPPESSVHSPWNLLAKKGDPGANGSNGESVISASEPAGSNCPDGGSKFTSASADTYACNGAKGDKGDPGDPGSLHAYTRHFPTTSLNPGATTTEVLHCLHPDDVAINGFYTVGPVLGAPPDTPKVRVTTTFPTGSVTGSDEWTMIFVSDDTFPAHIQMGVVCLDVTP
jgi:Collagen triple helix repeat (20 copies)